MLLWHFHVNKLVYTECIILYHKMD